MEQETWNLWSFRRWLALYLHFWVSISGEWVLHLWFFSDNAVCTWIVWRRIGFDSPQVPQVTPWWGLNEIALNVLPGQHPNSYQITLCNSRSTTIWITWHLSKNIIKHIIYKIYLNSSSKFHFWNIWSFDPPQMREHLAVANEQAGKFQEVTNPLGSSRGDEAKATDRNDLGTFFVTENGSLKRLLGTFVGKSRGIYI